MQGDAEKSLELPGASRERSRSPFGRILKWPTRADCKYVAIFDYQILRLLKDGLFRGKAWHDCHSILGKKGFLKTALTVRFELLILTVLAVEYSSGQRGQTVNLMANAFDGSNPSSTTTYVAKLSRRARCPLPPCRPSPPPTSFSS